MQANYDIVFKGIRMNEVLNIINDGNIQNTIDEDCEHVDVIVLPPDTDALTDEDEADDNSTGIVNVTDVPGPLEVHFQSRDKPPDTVENEDTAGTEISRGTTRKKKKLSNKEATYTKTIPVYTETPQNDNSCERSLQHMKNKIKDLTPFEIGELILNYNDMFDYIVRESVRYACASKNISDFSFDPAELRVFLGLLLLSGYHKLPSERHYWSEDDDLGLDIVKNAMSRNRYQKLKSLIHFNNNDLANDNRHDRGFKVRPLISMMNASFQQFGIFCENLSIDEMIVKYYGHHTLKQFIRGKPIRFGYKLWALCGSNGYCFNFDLYCGKETTNKNSDLGVGSRVVLNMLECTEHPQGHTVYFDNYFTSRDLLLHLRSIGYRATGTVRENRTDKCPLQTTKELEKMPRGSYDYAFDTSGEILFVKWNDNKCVSIGTNFDTVEPLALASRWNRTIRQKNNIQQPQVIKNYNAHMGGVDHHDWLVGKYASSIRGKKWYWALFTRMVDMAVVNGWIIYRMVHGGDALDLLEFRRCIAVQYLKMSTKCSLGRPLSTPRRAFYEMRYDGKDHFMTKRSSQRRCQLTGCNGRPLTFCKKCNVTLCHKCFEPYHTK